MCRLHKKPNARSATEGLSYREKPSTSDKIVAVASNLFSGPAGKSVFGSPRG